MKYFISTIIILTGTFLFGQTSPSSLNWPALIGKWQCTKVTRQFEKKSEDLTKNWTSYYCIFSDDKKCLEERVGTPRNSAVKSTVECKYKIDMPKTLISYENVTSTVSYTDGAYPDQVTKTSKPSLKVLNLTYDLLILTYTESPNSDGPGDYIFYFKKVK